MTAQNNDSGHPRVDPLEVIEAGRSIFHEATFGKELNLTDIRRLREGVRAWLTGVLLFMENEIDNSKLAPGLALLAALEDLDTGRSSELFTKMFEEPVDGEVQSTNELGVSDGPPRRTKRSGTPGKGVAANVRDGTAAAIVAALIHSGWKRGKPLEHVADRLGINPGRLRKLRVKLAKARAKGTATRDKKAFYVYDNCLNEFLAPGMDTEQAALARLERLVMLTGADAK